MLELDEGSGVRSADVVSNWIEDTEFSGRRCGQKNKLLSEKTTHRMGGNVCKSHI